MKDACRVCNIDMRDPDIEKELKKGKYLDDIGVISEKEMWEKIEEEDVDFWADLELFPWAKKLYEEMANTARINDLWNAMDRYIKEGCKISPEWVEELKERYKMVEEY